MRTYALMFLTLVVAVGGFFAYMNLQTPPAPPVAAAEKLQSGPPDRNAKALGPINPGNRPWISTLDAQRRLEHRVRASDYTPRGGNRVDVTDVDAEFFQYSRDDKDPSKMRTQMTRILGKTGHFEVNEAPKMSNNSSGQKSKGDKAAGGPPKRGLLNDVTIEIYRDWTPEIESMIQDGVPMTQMTFEGGLRTPNIVATMPNLSFDNETYEIATHEYTTIDGRYVRADEVPIDAHGDYDFKGQGMICRWNDVEGRLEYLEIAHGEYLVVNDPDVLHSKSGAGGLGKPSSKPTSKPTIAGPIPIVPMAELASFSASQPLNSPLPDGRGSSQTLSPGLSSLNGPMLDIAGHPIVFAAKGKSLPLGTKVPPGSPPPPGAKHKGPQPPYRAAFDQNVRISQGILNVREAELARADVMNVEFQSGSKSTTRPATNPATRPTSTEVPVSGSSPNLAATVPAEPLHVAANAPRPSPTTEAATQAAPPDLPAGTPASNPASQSASRPGTGPTTKPANEPIIIRWTGKLRLTPLEANEPLPIGPGESMVRLIGTRSPVQLTQETSKVWCTTADYFSSTGSAELRSSANHGPVVLWQHPNAAEAAKGGAQDATIFTQQLNYLAQDHLAILRGDSVAHILLPQDNKPSTRPTTLPANAAAPASQPTTRPADRLDAKWNREGRLHFKSNGTDSSGGESMAFDHAQFEGDVDIKHPQMALKSQALELFFEDRPHSTTRPTTAPGTLPADVLPANPATAPATRPSTRPSGSSSSTLLKRMIATTDVWCDLTDTGGKKQTITSQKLTMTTAQDADGKLYPRVVLAEGQAHAFDATQDLKAGGLEIKLLPATRPATTQPSTQPTNTIAASQPATQPTARRSRGDVSGDNANVELQSLRAWDQVAVRNAEGSHAVGDRMNVDVVNGQTIARIIGKPLATVTDPKGSSVTGPVIDFDPSRDWAKVTGKGTIHAIQAEPTKATTRPTMQPGTQPTALPTTQPAAPPKFADIFWEKDAELDGGKNRIFVNGPVHIVSTDADGTVNTADAANAIIELVDDKPASKPTTRPSTRSTTSPTTKPASTKSHSMAAGGGMNMLKDKVVSACNLEGNAIVSSTLSDAGGILKQTQIRSNKLRYETGNATAAAGGGGGGLAIGENGEGRLIVPGPGTLLYRDHRPPGMAKAAGGGQGGPDQARGVTAFRWEKSMTFDQADHASVMLGNVRIVQQADDPQAEPVHVVSDRVDALFESKSEPKPQAQVGVKPAAKPANGSADSAMQLKWLTLSGHVNMERAGSVMTADRADYNPATSIMTAVGTPQTPPTFIGATALDTLRADQIMWNTQTWAISAKNARGGTGKMEPVPPPKKR